MGTIKEMAKEHVLTTTKNIADLEQVNVDIEINNRKGTNEVGKEFEYNYITVNNQDYRMPNSVLGQLKVLLADNPQLELFKVKKTGEGMNTRYTVIPTIGDTKTLSNEDQRAMIEEQFSKGLMTLKGKELALEQLK